MPTICQFKFSRPTPIYYSGEQITGSITLSTTKQLPVEAIELSLVGCERVQWLERDKADLILHNDSTEKDNNMIYSSEREFLYDTYTLAKQVRLLQDEVIMEEFCFTLPIDALASRSLKYGEIVYTLQLTLQRKSDFNKVFKARVIVKNRLDLNEAPELCKLYSINSFKDVPSNMDQPLCFILPNGTGYVPGQSITYKLQGRHKFGLCKKILVKLCQRSIFHATNPETKSRDFCNILGNDLRIINQSSYVNVNGELSIPLTTNISINPSESCLIKTNTYIEALLINKKRILQKFIVPIIVGTVPLDNGATQSEDELLDHSIYCYDNLAAEANYDITNENIYFKAESSSMLSTSPAELILSSSTESSSEMLQKHVATNNSRIALTKADFCNHMPTLQLLKACAV